MQQDIAGRGRRLVRPLERLELLELVRPGSAGEAWPHGRTDANDRIQLALIVAEIDGLEGIAKCGEHVPSGLLAAFRNVQDQEQGGAGRLSDNALNSHEFQHMCWLSAVHVWCCVLTPLAGVACRREALAWRDAFLQIASRFGRFEGHYL